MRSLEADQKKLILRLIEEGQPVKDVARTFKVHTALELAHHQALTSDIYCEQSTDIYQEKLNVIVYY